MNQSLRSYIFIFTMVASFGCAAIEPPPPSSVLSATVSCYGERIVISSATTSDLLSFLDSVKDGWSSWGFITHPAGDIEILLRLKNSQEFGFFTWSNLRLVGTYGEKRRLSQAEAKQLSQLLPPKCLKPHNKKPKLQ
jgi:hypothetical protein